MRIWVFCISLVTLVLAAAAQEPPETPADAPEGFKQLIPRGQLAAIDDPVFVRADDAEISDDAWVLGVTAGGEAKAYSLNLLNRHEVVNDTLAKRPVAAVW